MRSPYFFANCWPARNSSSFWETVPVMMPILNPATWLAGRLLSPVLAGWLEQPIVAASARTARTEVTRLNMRVAPWPAVARALGVGAAADGWGELRAGGPMYRGSAV